MTAQHPPRSDRQPNLTLIFDGECGFCRSWVKRIAARDRNGRIEFLACQDPVRSRRFPTIMESACLDSMIAVTADGKLYAGADAVAPILRRLPRWRLLAPIAKTGIFLLFARPAYRWIARRRHCLGGKSCEL